MIILNLYHLVEEVMPLASYEMPYLLLDGYILLFIIRLYLCYLIVLLELFDLIFYLYSINLNIIIVIIVIIIYKKFY